MKPREVTTPAELLLAVRELVSERTGLDLLRLRLTDVERALTALARELGAADATAAARELLQRSITNQQFAVLAGYLTVGETYFLREKELFDALVERLLPLYRTRLEAGGPGLRIWSAGCATGEEPYSIAIALKRALPRLTKKQVQILATDINQHSLGSARAGVYGGWSFRGAPAWLKDRFFQELGDGRFAVKPEIKEMVRFSYLNLAQDAYPSLVSGTSGMDIIFCRNVLMYLTPESARQVVGKLQRSLAEGGWLMVSQVEASAELVTELAPVRFDGALVFRKESPAVEAGAPPRLRAPRAAPARPLAAPVTVAPPPASAAVGATALERAWYFYRLGRYGEAEKELQAEEPTAAGRSRVWALLARINANLGRLDQALELCRAATLDDKLNPGYHYLLATVLLEKGVWQEAVAEMKKTLYLDPEFVLAHVALGKLDWDGGRQQRAGKRFAQALKLLARYRPDQVLPESEGLTAGRLAEVVRLMNDKIHGNESVA